MRHALSWTLLLMLSLGAIQGCSKNENDAAAEAPPPAQVVSEPNANLVRVDNQGQVALATVTERASVSQLSVNGVVNPDVSRTVPVVTLASGRVVDVGARLGDSVKKGRLLFQVRSDDVSSGYADYRKAVADELLARKQLDRNQDLYNHGAIPQSQLETAQDAEDDAKVTLQTTLDHLRLLGNDPDHPSALVDIRAPISGVITDQQITTGSTVQSYSANPFTISDLSAVWILCDVYENDLPAVHLGDTADIRLVAYPNRSFKGTVSNISSILDPNLRTAKVRIQVNNPGLMRVGMFATVTFYGSKSAMRAVVPADAILHLHDADWVFLPQGDNQFRRTEVVAGQNLPNKMQEILSGLTPGQKIVADALTLQNTIDNE